MDPRLDRSRPRVPVGLSALAIGVLVASASLAALDIDPLVAFWAMTAGLPLVAFVVIIVVVLARRAGDPGDDRGAAS